MNKAKRALFYYSTLAALTITITSLLNQSPGSKLFFLAFLPVALLLSYQLLTSLLPQNHQYHQDPLAQFNLARPQLIFFIIFLSFLSLLSISQFKPPNTPPNSTSQTTNLNPKTQAAPPSKTISLHPTNTPILVRTDATTSASIISTITKNSELEVLNTQSTWLEIKLSQNQSGWINHPATNSQ